MATASKPLSEAAREAAFDAVHDELDLRIDCDQARGMPSLVTRADALQQVFALWTAADDPEERERLAAPLKSALVDVAAVATLMAESLLVVPHDWSESKQAAYDRARRDKAERRERERQRAAA